MIAPMHMALAVQLASSSDQRRIGFLDALRRASFLSILCGMSGPFFLVAELEGEYSVYLETGGVERSVCPSGCIGRSVRPISGGSGVPALSDCDISAATFQ